MITITSSASIDEIATVVRDEIRQAQEAWRNALHHAMAAGDALIIVQPKVAGRGLRWKKWLKENCFVSDRTAMLYVQLARHRDDIEAEIQRGVELSLRGARRLISGSNKSGKPAQSARSSPLSSLAWSSATPEERRHFVSEVGLVAWLTAMPPTWRSELEHRIDGLRTASTKTNAFDATISKALRQALSLQKTATQKDNTSASVAAALNGIINKLNAVGLDLNDVGVVVRAASATRKRAA
jgi:hypothetical protein